MKVKELLNYILEKNVNLDSELVLVSRADDSFILETIEISDLVISKPLNSSDFTFGTFGILNREDSTEQCYYCEENKYLQTNLDNEEID